MSPLTRSMLLATFLSIFVACNNPEQPVVTTVSTVNTDIQADIEVGSGEDFNLNDQTSDLAPANFQESGFTLRLSLTRTPTQDNNVPYRAHATLTWAGSSPLKGNLKLVVRRKQNTIPVNTVYTSLTLVKNKSKTVHSGVVKVSPNTLLCVDALFTRTAISTKTIGRTITYCLSASSEDKVAPKVTLSAGLTPKSLTAQAISTIHVTAPGRVNFTAIATDNVGIRKVQLLEGGMVKTESSSSPLNASINYVAADVGFHWYKATAYDAAGNVGSSELVKVEVKALVLDTTEPVVTLVAQGNPLGKQGLQTTAITVVNVQVVAPGSVTFTATATDNVGVKKIQLLENSIVKAETNINPLNKSITYVAAEVGLYTYVAIAYDAAGNVGASETITVEVKVPPEDQEPPTVNIFEARDHLTQGPTVTSGETLEVVAPRSVEFDGFAQDNIGVTRVQLLEGEKVITESPGPDFFILIDYVQADIGTRHTYVVRAFDAEGNMGSSKPITIKVKAPDTTKPTVTLKATTLEANGLIPGFAQLDVTAVDDTGVTKVQLLVNSQVVYETPGSHLDNIIISFSGGDAGNTFTYVAKAYDAAGNVGLSQPVVIEVKCQPGNQWCPGQGQGADHGGVTPTVKF